MGRVPSTQAPTPHTSYRTSSLDLSTPPKAPPPIPPTALLLSTYRTHQSPKAMDTPPIPPTAPLDPSTPGRFRGEQLAACSETELLQILRPHFQRHALATPHLCGFQETCAEAFFEPHTRGPRKTKPVIHPPQREKGGGLKGPLLGLP